jgi:mRNA-degrading endonuclease RelE of RelBE toxin-antitoxin system
MQHHATADFWKEYRALPQKIRTRADQKFSLLKANQQHPSLQFKKLGERQGQEIWSARITLNYRALAIKRTDGYLWFWIGDHGTYDSLVS